MIQKEKEFHKASPKDVFRIKDLHSIVKDDGSIDHNVMEDEMMHFETNGCKAINHIINGEKISDEDKSWIAYFWAFANFKNTLLFVVVSKNP